MVHFISNPDTASKKVTITCRSHLRPQQVCASNTQQSGNGLNEFIYIFRLTQLTRILYILQHVSADFYGHHQAVA